MLNAKESADDPDKTGQGTAEVTQGQPPAGHKKPDHTAERTQGARVLITSSTELTTAHSFGAERPERETADHPLRPCPRQANDRDGADQRGQLTGQSYGKSAENNPEQVEDYRDHVSIVTASPKLIR